MAAHLLGAKAGACPDANRLAAFVDATLDPSLAQELEHHIDRCASCRLLVAGLVRVADHDVELRPPDLSAPIADAILGPGDRLSRYIVLRCIGSGGMGVVYAAHDPELDRTVAIKLLHREQVDEPLPIDRRALLLREAQILARLSHPNIIGVHDVGDLEGRVFVAMEYAEGVTLREWLAAAPRSATEILRVFHLAGEGLAAAHHAGLVHRDFKPDNVLVGEDGRVRVVDFGLARISALGAPTVVFPVEPGAQAMTSSLGGLVAGTPAYMAPEQREGRAADARSDQYGFCVALHEALHGVVPGAHAGVEPPLGWARSGRVPNVVSRAIARGLALEPAQRFPSMSELLAIVSPDRHFRRRRARLALVGAMLLACAAGGYHAVRTSAARCHGASDQLVGIWDAGREKALRARFASSTRPYVDDMARGTIDLLDRYASSWGRMHTEACEAHARGEQSDEVHALQTMCLGARLQDLRATTNLFVSADEDVIRQAVMIASNVPRLEGCAVGPLLQTIDRPPTDPGALTAALELSRSISDARVLHSAGKYAEGAALMRPLIPRLHDLGLLRLEAEGLQVLGDCQVDLDDPKAAEQTFFRAAIAAERSGDLRLLVLLRYAIAWSLRQQGNSEEALRWSELVQAGLDRVGADPWLAGKVSAARMTALSDLERNEEAWEVGKRGLALLEQALGPNRREVASASLNLGMVEHSLGKLEEALAHDVRAYEIYIKLYGAKHPLTVQPMLNTGSTLRDLGRLKDARAWFDRALKVRRDLLHLSDRQVASAHLNIGVIDRAEGDLVSAERQQLESIRVYEATVGPTHRLLGWPISELGRIYLAQGRPERALPILERALLLPPRGKKSKPEITFPLGAALLALGKDESRARKLIASAEASYDPKNPAEAPDLDEIHAWRVSRQRTAQR